MPEGERAVLVGLHEAEPRLAVRQCTLVRLSWLGRLSRLCRSDGRSWIRVRDQPDGDAIDRRPPRCGAQRRALLPFAGLMRDIMSTMNGLTTRHPALTYYVLVFAISWGGVLLVVGPGGFPGTTEAVERQMPFVILTFLLGPALAGLLLTGLVYGKAGLRELVSRLLRWRVAGRWYAVALLTAPLLMMALLLGLSLLTPAFLPGIFTADDKATLLLVGMATAVAA